MAEFKHVIDIQAPPERVRAVMVDIERRPEWTPTISSVQLVNRGSLAVGVRARTRQPKLPPAEWEVTDVTPGGGFTWVNRGP